MSVLRIRVSRRDTCDWALAEGERVLGSGTAPLGGIPRGTHEVQVIVPAGEVLLTRARLPRSARRGSRQMLAFAVEEETLGDPQAHEVVRIGAAGAEDVLAVLHKETLKRWTGGLESAGIRSYELHCETLLLPWQAGEWSLAWDGREGFMRSGELEGAATDCAEAGAPPLSLRLALEDASKHDAAPSALAVYPDTAQAAPDATAWQSALGIPVRLAGKWDWRTAPAFAGPMLRRRGSWLPGTAVLAQLKPAAWIAAAALAIHALALVIDWSMLATEQRSLRHQMEARFRAAFPETLAVVDPALQMRRKLAQARHAAGRMDSGDFLPMAEKAAAALKDVPATLHAASYDSGRLALEFSAIDDAAARRFVERLRETGLSAERSRGSSSNASIVTLQAP